jgi:hypothetical protein
MIGTVAITAALARCPFKACPVRYRGGPDRLCAEHQDGGGGIRAAAASLGIDLSKAPGDYDGGHDGDGGR